MRRVLLTTIAVATAVASASAVAAAPSAGRHIVKSYTAATTAQTASGRAQGTGLVLVGGPIHGKFGLQYVKLRPADSSVSLRLADQTGRTVQALVQQTAKNGSVFQIGMVCGATSKPLALRPGGGTLIVRPAYGTCDQEASVPTSGKVFVTVR